MDANADDPRTSLERRPIADVLSLLGFQENRFGCRERIWRNQLTVTALPWLGDWHFSGRWVTRRSDGDLSTLGCPEFRHSSVTSPLELLGALYAACGDAFSDGEALPEELRIGRQFVEHERRTRALTPPRPTVWADREFLRFCLSYIDTTNDWSVQDYPIKFQFWDQQLRIETPKRVVFCPARGSWIATSEVSARDLFRHLPKRFLGERLHFSKGQHGSSSTRMSSQHDGPKQSDFSI